MKDISDFVVRDVARYGFRGTTLDIIKTHSFVEIGKLTSDNYICKKCRIILALDDYYTRRYCLVDKEYNMINFSCNDYLINQVLL